MREVLREERALTLFRISANKIDMEGSSIYRGVQRVSVIPELVARDKARCWQRSGNFVTILRVPGRFGPRFPPMNKAYDCSLLEMGQQVAEEMGISDMVHKGVYTCLGGPNFETVAELKMLRMVGVDAVGLYNPFLFSHNLFLDCGCLC